MSYGNVGACSSCKHQRRRCNASKCQLARYFPSDKIVDFQNVHRLFGVNNFIRILNSVGDHEREKTAESLILEANMRKDYPVYGFLAVKKELEDQIEACEKELDDMNKKISLCKEMNKLENEKYDLLKQLCRSSIALIPPTIEKNN